jgi:hypothetical protein
MTLFEALANVKDPRRKQGQRLNKEQLLAIIILANLCGHFGGRGIARFGKVHSEILSTELKLKHEVPSHVTISDFINRADQQELIDAFNKWSSSYVPIEEGALISGDGKALGSTVIDSHGSNQDFQAVVSLFVQKSGLVYAIGNYRNSKKSEIEIVRFMLDKLKGMGLTVFLDALHTQKKLLK